MPSTHSHSPASPADARGRYPTCESQGNYDPLTLLAAHQAAAQDAFLASPEFARQQAGQQALIAESMQQADALAQLLATTDQALVPPRSQGDVDQRGSLGRFSE